MFRFMGVLLALTSSASAAPQYFEDTSDGTRLACVTNITDEQRSTLWDLLQRNLSNRNYAHIAGHATGDGYLWDGTHTVFVSDLPEGVCIQYMTLDQPTLPVMNGEAVFEPVQFCHAPDVDFTFTWYEVVMRISRFGDDSICIWQHGDTFECNEENPIEGGENHYFVKARIAKKGKVLIFNPPGDEPQQFISRCDAF